MDKFEKQKILSHMKDNLNRWKSIPSRSGLQKFSHYKIEYKNKFYHECHEEHISKLKQLEKEFTDESYTDVDTVETHIDGAVVNTESPIDESPVNDILIQSQETDDDDKSIEEEIQSFENDDKTESEDDEIIEHIDLSAEPFKSNKFGIDISKYSINSIQRDSSLFAEWIECDDPLKPFANYKNHLQYSKKKVSNNLSLLMFYVLLYALIDSLNIPDKKVSILLYVFKLLLPSLPKTSKTFYKRIWEIWKFPQSEKYGFCQRCLTINDCKQKNCKICSGPVTTQVIINDLNQIIQNLLYSQSFKNGLQNSIKYRNSHSAGFEDINDGEFMKQKRLLWKELRSYCHFSVTLFIDAFDPFKSNFQIFPVLLVFNDLCYTERFKIENVILLGCIATRCKGININEMIELFVNYLNR